MKIPELKVSITKAAVDGRVVEVVEYEEYGKNKSLYEGRSDVSIPVKYKNEDILLPLKGEYNGNPFSPGVYSAGCLDFFNYPEDGFVERYIPKNTVTMTNTDNIRELIKLGNESRKLDEVFITTPDNITNIPIKENDQPEMIALKTALNSKHIDIDAYANRFGDNYPNDKRQLKSSSVTLNIVKRYCDNCDMEALLIIRDKSRDVPNPIGREISISLTEPIDDSWFQNQSAFSDSSSFIDE